MVYGTAHKQMAAVNNSKVCVGVDKVVFSMKTGFIPAGGRKKNVRLTI